MGHFYPAPSVFNRIQELQRQLPMVVNGLEEDILLRPEQDVVDELVDRFALRVPTLRPAEKVVVERGEAPGSPGTARVVFAVPFDGQPGLFELQPSSIEMTQFPGSVRDGELRLTVQQANPTKGGIEAELAKLLAKYDQALNHLRTDLSGYNAGLASKVQALVHERREQLLRTKNVLASLEIPVRRRADAVIPVPVKRRVQISQPAPAPGATFVPEWELSLAGYNDILASTRSMGTVMERAPGTFSGLAEEGIRDFFLALLNVGFEGAAMGEVFNGEGKTDILIRVGDRNAFIAECKVWEGEERFKNEALGQLLRFMGWRDTKCAILLFVHERSVTDIMTKADAVIRGHECFKHVDAGAIGELEHRYILHWPGDQLRDLHLALQGFPVPTTKPGRAHRQKRSASPASS